MSDDRKTAPFTSDQCESFNEFQRSGVMHPFTCPNSHTRIRKGEQIIEGDAIAEFEEKNEVWIDEGHVRLVAIPEGLFCPHEDCEYTQNWAWEWMLNWGWEGLKQANELFLTAEE